MGALGSTLGAKVRLVTGGGMLLLALGMLGLNWGEIFTVGSVRTSPASVGAGEDGAGSGSVGTSWRVGDRGAPPPGGSLTVVSVGASVGTSTPVTVGLGATTDEGLAGLAVAKGSGGISLRMASGRGMASVPPRSCRDNCTWAMA